MVPRILRRVCSPSILRNSLPGAGVWLVLCVSGALLGCATPSESDGPGRVISKSSYVRPPWAGKAMTYVPGNRLGYASYRKDRVRILDLGIKQAQIEATSQIVARFNDSFASFFVDFIKREDPKIPSPDRSEPERWYAELRRLSLAASQQFQAPMVRPESVYWEEVELGGDGPSGSQELVREFRIHVLMSFDRSEITDRLSILAQRLEEAPGGKFASALEVLDKGFPEIRGATQESAADKKEVEAIQTEIDSAGSSIESSVEQEGPRGRRFQPPAPTPVLEDSKSNKGSPTPSKKRSK